jgi:hypothetical protein
MNEQREVIVQQLSEQFAADRLTMDELERRLDLVYKATTAAELAALTADLPAFASPLSPSALPAGGRALGVHAVMSTRVRALLGNVERGGLMEIPSHLEVRAMLGNVELDLRDAHFGAVTEISIRAMLGNVEIVLPSGVRVENDGRALLGSFTCDVAPGAMPMVGTAPIVRFTGRALLGNVEIRSAATPYNPNEHAALTR